MIGNDKGPIRVTVRANRASDAPGLFTDPEAASTAIGGELGLTFRDSKRLPVHGWYPYVEGFSARYIEGLVQSHGAGGTIYDPFGGSGTVGVISSAMGFASSYSEANPFMKFVAETKVNARRHATQHFSAFEDCLRRFRRWAGSSQFARSAKGQDLSHYREAFAGRDFFAESDLRELQAMISAAREIGAPSSSFQDILLLAVASVTVACSHMTRRADLRRRREDEYIGRVVDVRSAVLSKLDSYERDIQIATAHYAPASFLSPDCRISSSELRRKVSLVLTSPPYLNGTNYIRNTKLELWLLGLIRSERDLSALNEICMTCGINNVVKGRPPKAYFDCVEGVANRLDAVSPDARIPALVRGYFSDMLEVLENCASYLRPEGRVVLDIGDSKFYGVHVPTDRLLIEVARQAGLRLIDEKLLARRHSRDKTPLAQVELTFTHGN